MLFTVPSEPKPARTPPAGETPSADGAPSAGRGRKRFGVVLVLAAMLLLAYLTIAILRSTLLSPTRQEAAPKESEQLDR